MASDMQTSDTPAASVSPAPAASVPPVKAARTATRKAAASHGVMPADLADRGSKGKSVGVYVNGVPGAVRLSYGALAKDGTIATLRLQIGARTFTKDVSQLAAAARLDVVKAITKILTSEKVTVNRLETPSNHAFFADAAHFAATITPKVYGGNGSGAGIPAGARRGTGGAASGGTF